MIPKGLQLTDSHLEQYPFFSIIQSRFFRRTLFPEKPIFELPTPSTEKGPYLAHFLSHLIEELLEEIR